MDIREQVPLAPYTTLRVGGNARFFAEPTTERELRDAFHFAHTHTLPVHILGGGANTLFSDAGWQGLVIRIALQGRDFSSLSHGELLVAHAGEVWDDVVAESVSRGLYGLENLSFVPGSVGASPVQNIACYGAEVSETIAWVEVYDPRDDTIYRLEKDACRFAYRDSFFKHEGKPLVITCVAYALTTQAKACTTYKDLKKGKHYKDMDTFFAGRDPESITAHEVREALRIIRGEKFPDLAQVGTAGSFFKNPKITRTHLGELRTRLGEVLHYEGKDPDQVTIPAGWLLERLGFRGVREGGVGTWPAHALAVVCYEGGTATELLAFVQKVRDTVFTETHILLEPEVCVVGEQHAFC
jgi:UDP-N-acetylmuramate dehydrogenase